MDIIGWNVDCVNFVFFFNISAPRHVFGAPSFSPVFVNKFPFFLFFFNLDKISNTTRLLETINISRMLYIFLFLFFSFEKRKILSKKGNVGFAPIKLDDFILLALNCYAEYFAYEFFDECKIYIQIFFFNQRKGTNILNDTFKNNRPFFNSIEIIISRNETSFPLPFQSILYLRRHAESRIVASSIKLSEKTRHLPRKSSSYKSSSLSLPARKRRKLAIEKNRTNPSPPSPFPFVHVYANLSTITHRRARPIIQLKGAHALFSRFGKKQVVDWPPPTRGLSLSIIRRGGRRPWPRELSLWPISAAMRHCNCALSRVWPRARENWPSLSETNGRING